ncbi:MAG TPA: rhodanese-like domain-containing protein [Thermoanaerobaculia bacterium]|nr:rhodanese-like domain-containing protein [Thermoanaerobaculia bacterium]
MAILVVGGILVAALVVWALTRTVEPESVMSSGTVADASTAPFTPPPDATAPTATAPTATGAIVPSATSGSVPPPTAAPQPQGNRAEVKRISAEDLRAQVGRNEVTVIDVRTSADYARGHIPGAINIPFASVETQFDSIPKGKPIVTYCT